MNKYQPINDLRKLMLASKLAKYDIDYHATLNSKEFNLWLDEDITDNEILFFKHESELFFSDKDKGKRRNTFNRLYRKYDVDCVIKMFVEFKFINGEL